MTNYKQVLVLTLTVATFSACGALKPGADSASSGVSSQSTKENTNENVITDPPNGGSGVVDPCVWSADKVAKLHADAEAAPMSPESTDPEYLKLKALTVEGYISARYPNNSLETNYQEPERGNIKKVLTEAFTKYKEEQQKMFDKMRKEDARSKVYAAALNQRYQCVTSLPYNPCFGGVRGQYDTVAGEQSAPFEQNGVLCILTGDKRIYVGRSPDPNKVIVRK